MHFALRLSLVLAVLFSLTGSGNARILDADRNRLQQLHIQSRQSDDAYTQVEIAYEVIGIYDKYKDQKGSSVVIDAQLNAQVNDFKRQTSLVDGVPIQGGILDVIKLMKKATDGLPDNVKKDARNLAKGASKFIIQRISDYLMGKLSTEK